MFTLKNPKSAVSLCQKHISQVKNLDISTFFAMRDRHWACVVGRCVNCVSVSEKRVFDTRDWLKWENCVKK